MKFPLGLELKHFANAVVALFAILLILIVAASGSAPSIDQTYGETTIEISADRGLSLYPGDCVQLSWRLEGIKSLHIDGEGKIGSGAQPFCPDVNRTSPLIEIWSQKGIYRQLRLDIHYLPDLALYIAAFVCVIGAILFSLYHLITHRTERSPPWRWFALAVLLLAVLAVQLRLMPTLSPAVEHEDGQVALRLWAENGQLVFPHECTDVAWSLVGAKSLHVNGAPVDVDHNPGHAEHCIWQGNTVELEIVSETGASERVSLEIPALFANLAHVPVFYHLCLFGLLLLALIYLPLAVDKLRGLVRRRATGDFAAFGAIAVVVSMLYLPYGFDSIPQLETWYAYAYFDGQTHISHPESYGRWWYRLPHALAYLIDSESFVSFHLLRAATFISKTALVYSIMRKLNARSLYAFLVAILFMLYPVNSGLLASRTMIINANTLWLLLAAYTALDYLEKPRRLALAGFLLTLSIHVVGYEASLAIIAIMPLLFWLRNRGQNWQNLNLTLLVYSVPLCKLAYLAILALTNRPFYSQEVFESGAIGRYITPNVFETLVQVLVKVYRQTFLDGWLESLATLGQNAWWPPTLIAVAVAGGTAAYLARQDRAPSSTRQIAMAMLVGLILIVAAIGVFMLLPLYSTGDWRLYIYVPSGAAIVVLCILLLLTAKLKHRPLRDAVTILACLILLLPALSRLMLQHDQFTRSADAKARILQQTLDTVPRPNPNVDIVMMTTLDFETLLDHGISELLLDTTFDSALFTLYNEHAPRAAFFCLSTTYCSNATTDEMAFSSHAPAERLRNTLFLELRPDLSVELIEDPVAHLNIDIETPYDAGRLYHPDAPLPPRAQTMLGPAYQR